MQRPKNKEELLTVSKANYIKVIDLIASYSIEEREKNFTPDKLYQNNRDIIAHLHHWNELLLGWYKKGQKGNKPAIPAEGYTWKTLPAYNKSIWETYLDKSLDDVLPLFKKSFRKVYKIIESHREDDLFEKKKLNWTGSTSLAAYLISCTCSHYDWAYKRIKKSMK